jgi:hypothetical protein
MMNFLMVAALASTALIGCKGDGETDTPTDGVALAAPVAIGERVDGNSAALKTLGTYHIETKEQYDALGDADIFPGGLDFDESDLVIVALGEQPTGGYSVSIESIQLAGGELAVTGKATAPGADAVVTQALTYPYSAVSIPNTKADKVVPYID